MLYEIETNVGFELEPQDPAAVVTVATAFGRPGAARAWRVRKRNPSSDMFRVEGPSWVTMVRAADDSEAQVIERQCRVARALPTDTRLVRPLTTADGACCLVRDGRAWTAYDAVDGDVYDGRQPPVEDVGAAAVELLGALRRLPQDQAASDGLPRPVHRPERWTAFAADLCSGGLDLPVPLAAGTERLLRERGAVVERVAAGCAELATDPAALVHNDLQHANVLSTGASVRFVDLEDIVRESPAVAAGHAVFKLLRHAVRAGARSLEVVRTQAWPALAASAAGALGLPDPADVARGGARRIVSDIFEIHAWYVERDDPSQLYDLEKRLHNLFELVEMTGDAGGLAAER